MDGTLKFGDASKQVRTDRGVQTMKQVPDRNKLRRDYLRKRRSALIRLSLVFVTLVACWCGAVVVITLLIAKGRNPEPDDVLQGAAMVSLGVLTICGVPAYFCWKKMKQIETEVKNLPYVAPITPDTLPADEILVRGSEEPTIAQSEVLLRAAKEVETPPEELLRVSQGKQP